MFHTRSFSRLATALGTSSAAAAVLSLVGAAPAQAGSATIIKSFANEAPLSLHLGPDNNLAGTRFGLEHVTVVQGNPPVAVPVGDVFTLTPVTGGATILSLHQLDGMPLGNVVLGQDDQIYGSVDRQSYNQSGNVDEGSITYALTPGASSEEGWMKSLIHDYAGGAVPVSLAQDGVGRLYVAETGPGQISRLTPPSSGSSWYKETLYSFKGASDGTAPVGQLAVASSTLLYGATADGGTGNGTVFALTETASHVWKKTIIYSFTGDKGTVSDANPNGGPVLGPDGALYGAASGSGKNAAQGEIYRLAPPKSGSTLWTETILHTFTGSLTPVTGANDGANPNGPLAITAARVIYGTTRNGGTSSSAPIAGGEAQTAGTLFSLKPPAKSGGAWSEAQVLAGPPKAAPGFMGGDIVIGNGVIYAFTSEQQPTSAISEALAGAVLAVKP